MTITITIVHDKGDSANQAQVNALESILTYNGENTNSYSISGFPHTIALIEVVPFGVTPPSHSLKPIRRVIYGADQPSTSGQFFNFGLSRGIGYAGADVSIHLEDVTKISKKNLDESLTKLGSSDFLEAELFGKVITKKFFNEIKPHFDDTKTISENIAKYKTEAVKGGLKNG